MIEIQIGVDQNPETLIGTEANLDQANMYNAGTVGKQVRNQCKSPKKKNRDDSANAVTEEIQDALLFEIGRAHV